MHKDDWIDRVLIELEGLEKEFPNMSPAELRDLAEERTENYMDGWADIMIDRAKDERMMDEGGASQTRKPKEKE
jgi:hypothetical protein